MADYLPQVCLVRNRNLKWLQRGFTLVELLIVIAIIALLTAMLFPVSAIVREQAKRSTCSSNLKQLGMAFAMYAQDFDDILPAPGGYGGTFWNQIDPNGKNDTLEPYIKNQNTSLTQIWVCPNLEGGTLDPPAKGDKWYYLNFPRSYAMNTFLRSKAKTIEHKYAPSPEDVSDPDALNPLLDPDGMEKLSFLPFGISRGDIPYPAQTVLLYEGIPARAEAGTENAAFNGIVSRHGDWRFAGGYWRTSGACTNLITQNGKFKGETCQQPGLHSWHTDQNNYLYCDGHVKAHRPVQEGWVPTVKDPGDFLVHHCRDEHAPCP